jgi:hypothetical protein
MPRVVSSAWRGFNRRTLSPSKRFTKTGMRDKIARVYKEVAVYGSSEIRKGGTQSRRVRDMPIAGADTLKGCVRDRRARHPRDTECLTNQTRILRPTH